MPAPQPRSTRSIVWKATPDSHIRLPHRAKRKAAAVIKLPQPYSCVQNKASHPVTRRTPIITRSSRSPDLRFTDYIRPSDSLWLTFILYATSTLTVAVPFGIYTRFPILHQFLLPEPWHSNVIYFQQVLYRVLFLLSRGILYSQTAYGWQVFGSIPLLLRLSYTQHWQGYVTSPLESITLHSPYQNQTNAPFEACNQWRLD